MKIQGITIEINGESSGLENALKKCDDAIKRTQRSLNDINKSLKFNPESVELLSQKQEYLSQKINETKEKLNALRNAQAEVEQQFKDGKIDQDKYNEFKRDIEKTESQLKTFEGQLKSTKKQIKDLDFKPWEKFSEKLKNVGGKLTALGKKMAVGITAPIVGLGVAMKKGWDEVDEAMDILVQKTGATSESLEDMKKQVSNIATSIPASFTEVANAVGEVNTQFGLAGKDAEKVSEQFVKFSKINNTDVSNSIVKVKQALSQFGESTARIPAILDQLNYTGQATGVNLDKLQDNLVRYGASLKAMGLDTTQSIQLLGQLSQEGVQIEQVFARLGQATAKFADKGLDLSQGLQEMQERFNNASSGTERFNIVAEIFGNRVAPQIVNALETGALAFTDFADASKTAGDSVNKTFEDMKDPSDEYIPLINSIKELFYQIVEVLQPMLIPLLTTLKDIIQGLTEKWKGLSPATQDFIIKATAITALGAPVISTIGGIAQAVGHLTPLLVKTVSGLASFIKTSSGLSQVASTGSTALGALGTTAGATTGIFAKLMGGITSVLGAIGGLFGLVGGTAVAVGGAIVAAVAGIGYLIYKYWDEIKEYTSIAWNWIKDTAVTIWNGIKDTASAIWDGLKNTIGGAWDWIKEKSSGIWNGITSTVSNIWQGMKSTASGIWQGLKNTVSSAWDNMKKSAETSGKAIASSISSAWEKVKQNTKSAWDTISQGLKKTWDSLKSAASSAWNWITDKFKSTSNVTYNVPKTNINKPKTGGGGYPHARVYNSLEWYDKGGIFNKPTIIGVGEKRPEFVGALDDLAKLIRENVPQGTGFNINISHMEIREEQDIQKVANELYRMIEREKRSQGI